MPVHVTRHARLDAIRLVVAWVVVVAGVLLVGTALTGPLDGSVGGADNHVERWLAARRSGPLTTVAQAVSLLGETWTEVVLAPVLLLLVWRWLRQARPVVFLAAACLGEITAYLVVVSLVSRPRPPVLLLDPGLEPLHSFPSGHVAAAMATYGGMAVLLLVRGAGRWRRLSIPLLTVPFLVGLARLYLGVHHPTDVATSVGFMTAWLGAAFLVLLRGP
jgi:membrane-associated phospholipid phosphatase